MSRVAELEALLAKDPSDEKARKKLEAERANERKVTFPPDWAPALAAEPADFDEPEPKKAKKKGKK